MTGYDIVVDTFYEFPPITGIEIHENIYPLNNRPPAAHAQGLLTAYAYHRRAARA